MNERMMERRASPPGITLQLRSGQASETPVLRYTFNFFRTNSMITA